jgi:predicted ATPase
MNRALDYRTDLYSLGVTLYEMFSRVLPFQSRDALELVYCHIAVAPTPLHQLKKGIPESLSNIVMKLMAKDTEKRYQSGPGLKFDLLKCLEQLEQGTEKITFELGQNDHSDQFKIPQKLYGREQESEALLDSFRRVASGSSELLLVTGLAGIGKSSLVTEIQKPVIENRGFFITGKFDQYQRNIPYSALIYAFCGLIRQILSESEENIQLWRDRILTAVGECGQIMIEMIPEAGLIIGQQPALPELNPVESQNRLNLIFLLFVKVFCLKGRPLVIFLDDLQWADLSSLKMMELLLTDNELKGILLISAYRDQKVGPTHPLRIMASAIEKTGARVTHLTLQPLDPNCVNRLLEETLNCTPEQAEPLATLCVQKTGGNPYFLIQFLNTLYRDKFIRFNPAGGVWQWDLGEIEGAGVTDNVIDMMIGRIQKLSFQTQAIIKLASCIGNIFDLKTLSMTSEKAPETVRNELWEALENELVLPVDDSYKYTDGIDNRAILYKFTHDRVQQAAYLSIDDSAKQAVHFKIGQIMLKNLSEHEKVEKIFEIVNHFSICSKLLGDKESRQFAELYLIAGEKAKKTKAYELASFYFRQGINLLEADGWEKKYELTLKLYMRGMEAACLSLDFQALDSLMEVIWAHTKSVLTRVEVYRFKIQKCITQNNLIEAIDTARSALSLLGIILPKKAGMFSVFWEYLKLFPFLFGRKVDTLADLPLMSNPNKLAAMNISSIVANSVYFTDTILMMIITLKQIRLTIRYGNAPASSFAYTAYGVFMNILGNVNLGYQFGKLALMLTEKYNFNQYKAKVLFMIGYLLRPWKENLKEILGSTLQAYHIGLENGDIDSASFCAQSYLEYSLLTGANLHTIQKEIAAFYHSISRFKQETALIFIGIIWQTIINISHPADNKIDLNGAVYCEDQMLPAHIREHNQSALLMFYYHKCLLGFLFEEYDKTIEYLEKLEKFTLKLKTNFFAGITFHFYNGLARLAVFHDVDKFSQTK